MSDQGIKEAVLTAATDVFKEEGYQNSDMRTIAKKAGIAVGTIYNYFSGKDKLFETIVNEQKSLCADPSTKIINDPKLTIADKIHKLCITQFAQLDSYGAIWQEIVGIEFEKCVTSIYEHAVREKTIIDIQIDKTVLLFTSVMQTLSKAESETGNKEWEENSQLMVRLFWFGLQKG